MSSLVRVRSLTCTDRRKQSQFNDETLGQLDLLHQHDMHNDVLETSSLQLNERWHNRFAKENRQKLILQQQTIDQQVKLIRVQKQSVGSIASMMMMMMMYTSCRYSFFI
jgi:hypothetical protein